MVVLLFITCWIRGSGRIAGVECDDEYRASIEKHLNVVFVPDYNVSVAELLIPRGELSQHMSSYPFPFQFEDSNEVLIPRGELSGEIHDYNFFLNLFIISIVDWSLRL